MKRFILILAMVLVVAATPLFAKGFVSLGADLTFPTFDFPKDFRGDLTLSAGSIPSSEKNLAFGFYSFNTLRVPFCTYDSVYGFSKVDMSDFLGLYLSSIDGIGMVLNLGSKFDLVLGAGLAVELDTMAALKMSPVIDFFFGDVGVGARADLIFNLTDSIFVDFGVEASYFLFEYYQFLDPAEGGTETIHRLNYPSCGLRAGIKF